MNIKESLHNNTVKKEKRNNALEWNRTPLVNSSALKQKAHSYTYTQTKQDVSRFISGVQWGVEIQATSSQSTMQPMFSLKGMKNTIITCQMNTCIIHMSHTHAHTHTNTSVRVTATFLQHAVQWSSVRWSSVVQFFPFWGLTISTVWRPFPNTL